MQRQVMEFTLLGQLTKTNQSSDCIFVHSVCNAISMTQVFLQRLHSVMAVYKSWNIQSTKLAYYPILPRQQHYA
jgi:hypothetical protein